MPCLALRCSAAPHNPVQAYIGFPLAFGMASLDPGFTLIPVFDLRAE